MKKMSSFVMLPAIITHLLHLFSVIKKFSAVKFEQIFEVFLDRLKKKSSTELAETFASMSENQSRGNERLKIQTPPFRETLFIEFTEKKLQENCVFDSNVS